MLITIERIEMTGRGPRYLYKLVSDGKTLLVNPDSNHGGSFSAYTRKKDAVKIAELIKEKGIDYVMIKIYGEV